jgi:acetolactate synthase-1/2/3 large subunit
MSSKTGRRGADRVAEALGAAGVSRVFSLSGNQIMPVYDALLERHIDIVHVRHEAAAVHMADAWGQLTGQPGVALLTAGPGHANAVSALYSALCAESPVLMLSGHAPIAGLGQGAFQEMAQALIAAPVCKAAWTVERGDMLASDIIRGLRLCAQGRPGPVHLSLPVDLLEGEVEPWQHDQDTASPHGALPLQAAREIASMLRSAQRPLILAGPAFARGDARSALDALSGSAAIPAVAMESPRGLNDPALGAFAECLSEADQILLLARRPDFMLRFARPPALDAACSFIMVEPDNEILSASRGQLGERLLDAQCADPISACLALTHVFDGLGSHGNAGWCVDVASAVAYRPPDWDALPAQSERGIHPVTLCRAVARVLEAQPDSVLVCDGGEFGQWAQSLCRSAARIINGPSGAIGGSPAYAAGASLARPGVPVIALLGDGTAGFHLSEFDTAVRWDLPYVAVIGNDARWNAEYQIQLREFGPERLIGCELLPSRYDLVMTALGGHGENVEDATDLEGALARALDSGKPACVNVRLDGQPAPVVRRG